MGELWWDSDAAAAVDGLEGDAARATLARRIAEVLIALAVDSGAASVRRHRFSNGLWRVQVHGDKEDWMILWSFHDDDPDHEHPWVQYVGPDLSE